MGKTFGLHDRRLGGARRRPAPAPGAPGAHQVAARGVGDRGAAVLRHEQHPLHHGDPHRHLGDGQARALLPAAAGRRPGDVGLRLGGAPPRDLLPVARGPLAGRDLDDARGDVAASPGAPRTSPAKIRRSLEERGLLGEPVGVDVVEPAVLFALQREGIEVVDGQQLMQQARMIKTRDEIVLLDTACMMVDAAYEQLYRDDAPGDARERVRRARQQGALRPRLRARRGRQRDLRRALLAAPPRLLRSRAAPGRPRLLRHPALLHGLPHLLLPHVRGRQRVARARRRVQALPRTSSTRRSRRSAPA